MLGAEKRLTGSKPVTALTRTAAHPLCPQKSFDFEE
jgi:hypothetical protein